MKPKTLFGLAGVLLAGAVAVDYFGVEKPKQPRVSSSTSIFQNLWPIGFGEENCDYNPASDIMLGTKSGAGSLDDEEIYNSFRGFGTSYDPAEDIFLRKKPAGDALDDSYRSQKLEVLQEIDHIYRGTSRGVKIAF